LALKGSFVPPEDVSVQDGFQKRVVWVHRRAISSGGRSTPATRQVDNQLNVGLS
jgi:hypothetical protein